MTIKKQWLMSILCLLANANGILFGADALEKRNTLLHKAIQAGVPAKVAQVITGLGADPNYRDAQGHTPLINAIVHNPDEGVIRTLITHNANPNFPDPAGNSPLCHAIMLNRSRTIIRTLIEGQADPRQGNYAGETPWDLWKRLNRKKPHSDVSLYLTSVLNENRAACQQFQEDVRRKKEQFCPTDYARTEFLSWVITSNQTPLVHAILEGAPLTFIHAMLACPEVVIDRGCLALDPLSAAIMKGRPVIVLFIAQRAPYLEPILSCEYLAGRIFSLEESMPKQLLIKRVQAWPHFASATAQHILCAEHYDALSLEERTLVLCAAIDGEDLEAVQRLAPLCQADGSINLTCTLAPPHLTPIQVACAGSTGAIVRCLREHGADITPIVATSKTLRGLAGKFNQRYQEEILAVFADVYERKAQSLITEEAKKQAEQAAHAARAAAINSQRMRTLRLDETPVATQATNTDAEEDQADIFDDPDGNWVIHGLAARLHSSSPVAEHVPAAGGSPEQTKRRTLTASYYDYHARVQRWVSDPHQVFIDDPEYKDCPEDQHAATIMRHAACQIIDAHTANCCITEKNESDVIVALCPCLIIPDQGAPETRIFKCCVELRTKSVFHRFFHKAAQAPAIFSAFHPLPTVDEHAELAGAGTPIAIGADGSMLLQETEQYAQFYDATHRVTIYCAKPKQEAIQ